MLRDEPLRQQRHLAHQRRAVVRRELGRAVPALDLDGRERLERVAVHRVRIVAGVEAREVLGGAQVLEQQQPALHIHLVNVRNVDARRFEQTGDLHVGPNVLLAGGRVHDDEGPTVGRGHPEIAAKAGVAGGRLDGTRAEREPRGNPVLNQREARVGWRHVRWERRRR